MCKAILSKQLTVYLNESYSSQTLVYANTTISKNASSFLLSSKLFQLLHFPKLIQDRQRIKSQELIL